MKIGSHIYAMLDVKQNATFYEILNVDPHASTEEINKAYCRIMNIKHPDKNIAPGYKNIITETAQVLNHIKEILTDSYKRAEYDRLLANENRDTTQENIYSEDINNKYAREENVNEQYSYKYYQQNDVSTYGDYLNKALEMYTNGLLFSSMKMVIGLINLNPNNAEAIKLKEMIYSKMKNQCILSSTIAGLFVIIVLLPIITLHSKYNFYHLMWIIFGVSFLAVSYYLGVLTTKVIVLNIKLSRFFDIIHQKEKLVRIISPMILTISIYGIASNSISFIQYKLSQEKESTPIASYNKDTLPATHNNSSPATNKIKEPNKSKLIIPDTMAVQLKVTTYKVVINSNPAGANIFINNKYYGKTPFGTELEPGRFLIDISLNGFISIKGRVISVSPSSSNVFNFVLQKEN